MVTRIVRHPFWAALTGLFVLMLVLAPLSQAIASPDSGTISGTVYVPAGWNGSVPQGTAVYIVLPSNRAVYGKAALGAGNSFSLGPVPKGLYVIYAKPPAGSPLGQSVDRRVSLWNGPVTGLKLHLTAPQFDGTVVGPGSDTPIPSTVTVRAANGAVMESLGAPQGTFFVGGLPAGTFGLVARPNEINLSDPLYNSKPKLVTVASPSQPVTLTLQAAQLWGTVVDQYNNRIPLATIHAVQVGNTAANPPLWHTDVSRAPTGTWSLADFPGNSSLLVWAEPPFNRGDLEASTPKTITLPATTITLTLNNPPKTVSGKVTTSGGQAVQDAEVLATRTDRAGTAQTTTDAGGNYSMNLAGGLWDMTVQAITGTSPAKWVYPLPPQVVHFDLNDTTETRTQNFTVLVDDAWVTGSVVMPDNSAPPFTVTVRFTGDDGIGRKAVLTSTNTISLSLPSGAYKVAVLPDSSGYLGPVVDPIAVPADGTYTFPAPLTLVALDATISGTISDASGPVPCIPVIAYREGAPGVIQGTSDSDGNYQLAVGAGTWQVRPAPTATMPYIYNPTPPTLPDTRVTVGDSQTVQNVNFTLTDAPGTIVGQMTDSNGNPIQVDGWADAIGTGATTYHNGAPIQAGLFSVLVPYGSYNVTAHLPAGSSYMSVANKPATVSTSTPVTITLAAAAKDATIAGRLRDTRNDLTVTNLKGSVGAWMGDDWTGTQIDDGNGTYTVGVAAGVWHLAYWIQPNQGYVQVAGTRDVAATSGKTVNLDLPLLATDSLITGTVFGKDDQPLGGVTVSAKGVGPAVAEVLVEGKSNAKGLFTLKVPHGFYRLSAATPKPGLIQPVDRHVWAPVNGVSANNGLYFRTSNATLSGSLTVSTAGQTGTALVWAWTEDGGFVHASVPITSSAGTYSLNVLQDMYWHVGAVLENSADYWTGSAEVQVTGPTATENLTLGNETPKPGAITVYFDSSQPERVQLSDGTALFIPAGALPTTGNVMLRAEPLAAVAVQRGVNVYSYGYAFTAYDSAGQRIDENFNQNVVVTFHYDPAVLTRLGIEVQHIRPSYYSTTEDRWIFPESYSVDTTNDEVSMQIDHFTSFALADESSDLLAGVFLPAVSH
jgi:hypothetical protein